MKAKRHWTKRAAVVVVAICCLLAVTAVDAQSKKSAKQADSLEKAGDSAKAAVQDLLDHLGKMLKGYNAIVNGEAKNPQSAYKKLVGDLNGTEKKTKAAEKELASLNKEADSFFRAWEQDLSSIRATACGKRARNGWKPPRLGMRRSARCSRRPGRSSPRSSGT